MSEMISVFRTLLIGKDYIPSRREYKYALLRGQFAIIIFVAAVLYSILDTINKVEVFIPWYGLMIVISVLVIVLNRVKQYAAATIFLLTLVNSLIFLFADVDHPNGGVYFFFMTCSITGMILMGYYSLYAGFFFALLPIVLGYIAFVVDLKLLPAPVYEPGMVEINFFVNFIIGTVANFFVIYFLMARNRESEKFLRENQEHSTKIAEEITQKNTQLAKTNEELDRFVYSASHDMRAPLSSLLGLINLCEKTADPNEVRMYLELMKGRIKTMEGFIREVTDYSRNTRLEIVADEVALESVIMETTRNLSYIEVSKRVRVEIQPSCKLNLCTDAGRLKVIFNNLISNAYRYHRFDQDDPYIIFSAKKENGMVTIHVEDNGTGILPEHHQKIFDMFFRASLTSEGSGLGLYIVKETLQKLGGSIWVESDFGKRTRFSFSIPA
jgi:signal transduction histidine kinase